jgi:hypothetical protein
MNPTETNFFATLALKYFDDPQPKTKLPCMISLGLKMPLTWPHFSGPKLWACPLDLAF